MMPAPTISLSGVSEEGSAASESEEEEEEASVRAEVMREQQQEQQQHDGGGGMCAAGRWLLGTFFAALAGFVTKNFLFPDTTAATGTARASYSLGGLALDAALVRRSINRWMGE